LAAGLSHRYRIVRRLGAGGMGTVFLAQQMGVGNRPVALKVLNRRLLDDPQFLLRFQNEAGSTGLIHHPNVVTIYESGQADDGTPYIAMEFLEGEPLRQVLNRRGALPITEAAEILQQAARGLNAAHKLGIIHRDLKPDNIFLTHGDEGELVVKVVDFGVAKLRESATHTQTGMVLGTPAYISYEQACGMKSDELDARSDVYSLGVVAYEMLSGRVPFHSDTPLGYVRKHMLEEPPPFRAVAQGLAVPAEVERAVMRALEKDRDRRYASALDFARDFAQAAAAPWQMDSPRPFAATRQDEPEASAPRFTDHHGERPAPPAAPAARQAEIGVKTPPALDASREQTRKEAASYASSPDAASEPAAFRQPSVPNVESRTEPKRVPPQPLIPQLEPVQKSKVSRAMIVAVGAAVEVVIVAVLFLIFRPSASNPGPPQGPAPSVNKPAANPNPPSQRPEESVRPAEETTARPVNHEPKNPAPAANAAEIRRKVKAAIAAGDSYYDDGHYDRAIAAYEGGLTVDPNDAQLHQRIQRAKTAEAAESSVPQ
jgi:serine/threonine protein kinase